MKKLILVLSVIILAMSNIAAEARPVYDPRPAAWCGWGLKKYLGISDIRLNVARNWAWLYGHPARPGPGVVVVFPHHVGQIVNLVSNNRAIVHSFNDGNRERTRERSIAGAIAFRS